MKRILRCTIIRPIPALDYGHNFYAKDTDALNFMLPKKDGKPNYQAMELFISAIQKMEIKDFVLYMGKRISAAKAVKTTQE